MAAFAVLREAGPFARFSVPNILYGEDEPFYAVTRHADVVEISRRPTTFCSGQGSISIQDIPTEAMEFFGSFIVMDDPRHARLRGIVARSFTPRKLQGVLDSVERICAEVIDGFCEQGEVDLVEALSVPFPLLVICDMMGIPRSEYATVRDATNVILGSGDPELLGGRDPMTAFFEAGMTLTALMNELAEERRKRPTDDLTTALVHSEDGEEILDAGDLGPFFILLAVAGNDTTRTATSLGMHLLGRNPDQRRIWQDDLEGCMPTAIEELVRCAAPVVFMRRTVTEPVTLSGHDFEAGRQAGDVLWRGEPRPGCLRRPRALRRAARSQPAPRLRRTGPALLPWRPPGAARAHGGLPPAPHPSAGHRGGGGDPVPLCPRHPAGGWREGPAGPFHAGPTLHGRLIGRGLEPLSEFGTKLGA